MNGLERANLAAFRRLGTLLAATACLLAAGCYEEDEPPYPARIHAVSGDHQTGMPDEPLQDLVVRVLSRRERDFLGRKGGRTPMADVQVTFEVEDPEDDRSTALPTDDSAEPENVPRAEAFPQLLAPGAKEPDTDPQSVTVVTDDSGQARVRIRLGRLTGDWRIEARVERIGRKDLKEHFRVVSGIERVAAEREVNVGEDVDLELRLGRRNTAGKLVGLGSRAVYFRVVGQPEGVGEEAAIENSRDVTNSDGVRKNTTLTLGDHYGTYTVLAEVEPKPGDRPLRGVLFTFHAVDWIVLLVQLAGGALLFLLGVRILANGFLILFSPHLHLATGPLASNRFLGYLGGVLSGATFQSSSSITAHLVSFANGGLLSGRGALGMLLGANVGATVLPQLLSLHLEFLVAPFLAIGLLFILLPRRTGRASWGGVFLGAGLVFTGWALLDDGAEHLALASRLMTNLLPPLVDYRSDWPTLAASFGKFLAAGVAAGFILRTSNLIVIAAMLLGAQGLISPATAMPLVIGANLGSGLNSFVRALFKVREAKRVGTYALVLHVVASVLVSALTLIPWRDSSPFLWLVEWTAPGALLHSLPENVSYHVATAHCLYNLLGSLVLLAFPSLPDRWSRRLLRRRVSDDELKPYRLDENLIAVPSLALRQAVEECVYLTELCRKTIAEAFDSFRYGDSTLADQVVRRAEVIAGIHRDLSRYLVLVGENQLSRRDASELESLQAATSCLARIGESGEFLRELTSRRVEEKIASSDDTDRDLSEVYDLIMAQFDNILILLRRGDSRVQDNAIKMVERLVKFRSRLEVQWRQRIEEGDSPMTDPVGVHVQTLIYQQAFDTLFQVAAHLAHIAERMRIVSPERL